MRALIFAGVLIIGSAAWSQETVEGPYVGIGLGDFDFAFTLGPTSVSFSDSTTIRSLYGGYRFSERWAVEGSYGSTSTVHGDFSGFPLAFDYDINGLRGLAYFGTIFVGIGYWSADINLTSTYTSAFPGSDSDVSFILGGEWPFGNDWSVRIDYELFDIDGSSQSDPEAFSAAVHYRFGRRE
jgi:Outer membrane protein beta-barrel domain